MSFRARAEDFPEGSLIRRQLEAAEAETQTIMAKWDGEETPGRRRIKNRPEEDLQKELIRTADSWPMKLVLDPNTVHLWPASIRDDALGTYLYHIPNQRSVRVERRILAAMGVRPGVSDLFLQVPVARPGPELKGGLYMECKAGDNDLTDKQQAFLDRALVLGYDVASIRDGIRFQEVIRNYFRQAVPLEDAELMMPGRE